MNHFRFEPFIDAYANQITTMIIANPGYYPFHVTKTFANPRAYPLKSVAKYLFQQNERIHIHIQSRLTTNYSRKPELFVRSFDFLDVSNTKKSFDVNLECPDAPHIHSICLIHHKTLSSFTRLRDENFASVVTYKMRSSEADSERTIKAFPTLKTIHAEPVRIDNIRKTLSYAAKLIKNFSVQKKMNEIDFFDALPNPNENSYRPNMTLRPFPRERPTNKQ